MSATATAGALVAVLVLGALALVLASRATRLHRLHLRVDTSRATLDAALRRRADAVRALAASGRLPPADARRLLTAVGAVGAVGALGVVPAALDDAARERAESALSRTVRAVLTPARVHGLHASAAGAALLADLAAAGQRVVLARGFANEAVTSARRLRRTRLVRRAHLAGRAPLPRTFDVDDEPPALAPGPVASVPGRAGGGGAG